MLVDKSASNVLRLAAKAGRIDVVQYLPIHHGNRQSEHLLLWQVISTHLMYYLGDKHKK